MEKSESEIEKRYLVGLCPSCHTEVYSDEKWQIENNRPTHEKCCKEESIKNFEEVIEDIGAR